MNTATKKWIKLGGTLLVAALLMAGSFLAGMVFYAANSSPAQAASLSAALPFLGATGAFTQTAPAGEDGDLPPSLDTFWEAWEYLNKNFYGEIPSNQDRMYGAIRGMVNSFGDQHTAFIDPVRAAIASENIQGSFSGIGATVRMDEAGRLEIVDPMPDSPALKAGLRPGDIVIKVDDQPLDGMNLFEAVLLIRGPTGSTVVLTVFREGELEPFDVSIVRDTIELEVVESELIDAPGGGKIGYVRLTQFSGGAADKVTAAIGDLVKQGATSMIFDLRSNPGGLLSEAVNVSSVFVKPGETIVRERLKGGDERVFEAKRNFQAAVDMPLVVLINQGSASASEIVAGAIQDLGRGTIMGKQSFGKGSVQLPHTLSDGSELRVTIAEWLTPNGRQIHGEGISPDVEAEMSFEDLQQQRDPQREAAVEFLNKTTQEEKSE